MWYRTLFSRLLLFISMLPAVASQTPAGVRLDSPLPGEPLQGKILIIGSTAVEGFAFAELTFTYTGAPAPGNFLIAESTTPVESGPLTEWDTSLLTDGIYTLQLTVMLNDGSQQTAVVEGLRIRNYTPIETPTPTPTPTATPTLASPTPDPRQFTATPPASPTPTATATLPPPTRTPLPPNPARLPPGAIGNTLLRGAAGALAAFLLLGLYTSLRKTTRP